MIDWLVWFTGTTNTIVTQQRNTVPDLLVNVSHRSRSMPDKTNDMARQLETNAFEFSNPLIERQGALTGADRKFIDDLVKDVNDGWNEADPSRPLGMQYVLWSPQGVVANEVFVGRFKGSDDYLRSKVRLPRGQGGD